jgi:hypothetical protein
MIARRGRLNSGPQASAETSIGELPGHVYRLTRGGQVSRQRRRHEAVCRFTFSKHENCVAPS